MERQLHLDEHDQAVKELEELGNPQTSPQRQAAAARAELERLVALASQPVESLQPRLLRTGSKELTDALRNEMKDAIDATQGELKDWQTKLEEARALAARAALEPAALQAKRDKQSQQVATLKNRGREHESCRACRQDRRGTAACSRATHQFPARGACRGDPARRSPRRGWPRAEAGRSTPARRACGRAHVQLARKILDPMQLRYREASDLKERALKQAAASQENRDHGRPRTPWNDTGPDAWPICWSWKPRSSNLNRPPPRPRPRALEEERSLADRAEADFTQVKQLLDDGNVSRLDALRLNNDFRRIGPERNRLLKTELSSMEKQLQYYENALTNVELELIEDSLVDQIEHDTVLDRLASEHHAEARSQFAELKRPSTRNYLCGKAGGGEAGDPLDRDARAGDAPAADS